MAVLCSEGVSLVSFNPAGFSTTVPK